jgi:hypothetical protein
MTIVREGFPPLVSNAFGSFGLPPEAPYVIEFPHSLFFTDSDMTPLAENLDKLVYGLTQWQPSITKKGLYYPAADVVVEGQNYQEAFDKMNNLFLQKLWGDGLPLIPPTQERVDWILTGTDLASDYVLPGLGKIDNRGGVAAVKSLAICLAMAGARPEYFPVVLAIVEAMTQVYPNPDWNLAQMTATTRSTFPAFIVSGPISNQIRLNSGYGCLGPDPRHSANASIGRAIRLIMQILGGATAGIATMSNFGGMRFTNAILAEDEEGLPPGWKSLGEWRGFKRGENCVTGEPIGHFQNCNLQTSADALLETFVRVFDTPDLGRTANRTPTRTDPDLSNGFYMFPDGAARILADAGYSRDDIREYIFEHLQEPKGFANAEQILLVVCGGEQAQHSYKMTASKQDSRVSKPIVLPANWDALLAQAEKDLGPNPGHTG